MTSTSQNQNHKILLVDDDKSTLLILSRYLTTQGFSVVSADNAARAAELIKKEKFDFVITDLNMPEVSGFDLLLWLKKYSPRTMVAVISAYTETELIEFSNKKGAVKFFSKPLKLDEISYFLKKTLSKKGFAGNVNDTDLTDILRVIAMSDKARLISVNNPVSEQNGFIYIKTNRVIHAEYGGLEGSQAFYKMLGLRNGIFSELSWVDPFKETITQSFQELISKYNKNKNTEIKILVVDDDKITTLITEKVLKDAGYTVTITNSAVEGAKILHQDFYDLVITDINMPEVSGVEFILWINAYSPASQVIIISSIDSEELEHFASQRGVIRYFRKPPNFPELKELISDNFESKGFTGAVSYINLSDFLNMLAISGVSKLIRITDPVTRQAGEIYIRNGEILHARYGEFSGEEAFYSMLALKNGLFFDLPWMAPEKETVKASYASLVKKLEENINKINGEINNLPSVGSESTEEVQKVLSLVRRKDEKLKKANAQAMAVSEIKIRPEKKYAIYEDVGVALGVVIGNSTKPEVLEKMREYSRIDHSAEFSNRMLVYEDVGVNFIFNENDTLEEIRFENNYHGKTSKGLQIGDSIMKAIELYGNPRVSTIKGAVWDNIAVFYQTGMNISSIKLREHSFFASPPVVKPETEVSAKVPDDNPTVNSILSEQKGTIFGVKIGITSQPELIWKMQEITKEVPLTASKHTVAYEKLGVVYYFDEKEKLKEIIIKSPFQGKTHGGLSINDPIGKALTHYGKPKIITNLGAIWDNVFIVLEDGLIKSIRVK